MRAKILFNPLLYIYITVEHLQVQHFTNSKTNIYWMDGLMDGYGNVGILVEILSPGITQMLFISESDC